MRKNTVGFFPNLMTSKVAGPVGRTFFKIWAKSALPNFFYRVFSLIPFWLGYYITRQNALSRASSALSFLHGAPTLRYVAPCRRVSHSRFPGRSWRISCLDLPQARNFYFFYNTFSFILLFILYTFVFYAATFTFLFFFYLLFIIYVLLFTIYRLFTFSYYLFIF